MVAIKGDPPRADGYVDVGGTAPAKETTEKIRKKAAPEVQEAPKLPPKVEKKDATPKQLEIVEPPKTNKTTTTQPQKTTLTEARAIAQSVVDCLRQGDTRQALDILYGARKGPEDKSFGNMVKSQMAMIAKDEGMPALLGELSPAERVLFEAYLRNPDGKSGPHDWAELAVQGLGTGEQVLTEIFADMWTRAKLEHPDDPASAYRQALSDFEQRFAKIHGPKHDNRSLDELLYKSGLSSELDGADTVRYRAAKYQAPLASRFFEAGAGKMLGTSEEEMLGVLEQYVGDPTFFARLYATVAHDDEDLGHVRREIEAELSGVDKERALALIDTKCSPEERIHAYLKLTLEGVASGDVAPEAAMRALRTLVGSEPEQVDGSVLVSTLDETLVKTLAGKDPVLAAMLQQMSMTGDAGGADVQLARIRELIEDLPRSLDQLGYLLENLPPESRNAIFLVADDLQKQINEKLELAASQDAAANAALSGLPSAHVAPTNQVAMQKELLAAAMTGRLDASALLHFRQHGLVKDWQVVSAVGKMTLDQRATLAEKFDEKYGSGAFKKATACLDADRRQELLLLLDVPKGTTAAERNEALTRVREILSTERGDAGWVGVSTYLMDRFGFSGPVLDDAMRELTHAVKEANAYATQHGGELRPEDARNIITAQQRLGRVLSIYNAEQESVAEGMEDVTSAAITVAVTAGAGITIAAVARAALASGMSFAGSHTLVEGPNYTGTDAAFDFFRGAALEVVGMGLAGGLMKGGGLLLKRGVKAG